MRIPEITVDSIKYTPSLAPLSQLVKNASKIALPAIALVALSTLQCVEAGPLFYSVCVGGCIACTGPAGPVFIPGCMEACLGILCFPSW